MKSCRRVCFSRYGIASDYWIRTAGPPQSAVVCRRRSAYTCMALVSSFDPARGRAGGSLWATRTHESCRLNKSTDGRWKWERNPPLGLASGLFYHIESVCIPISLLSAGVGGGFVFVGLNAR